MSFCKMEVVGNLGRDVEIRFMPSGDPVGDFSIAVNGKGKDKDKTTWLKVVVYGKQAEFVQKYFVKGSQIFVRGDFSLEEWADRDGKARTTPTVNAKEIEFVGSKIEHTGADNSTVGMKREGFGGHVTQDDSGDVPF